LEVHTLSRSLIAGFAAFCGLMGSSALVRAQKTPAPVRLPGHIPLGVSRASLLGRVDAGESIPLALTLPLRHEAELDAFIARVSNPQDPLYGQYLTPAQFAAQYAPTQADYDALTAYVRAQGLTVTNTHANRLVLDVAGPAAKVEAAFGVHLHNYRDAAGRAFRAPDQNPILPAAIAGRLKSVVGLDTAGVWRAHSKVRQVDSTAAFLPRVIGSGPGGGMTPSDIKAAYNLSGSALTGSGQTLAVFELDGYRASDISNYESYYNLPAVTVENVLVDNASGRAGSGATEVTLDIELQIALAPGASKFLVYEGPNSNAGVIDTYNRIATDDLAQTISTSWGLDEGDTGSSIINSESAIFKQMASQGQSIFAAAGDQGAYDNGSSLSVDDPASQPYVTGAGGTTLATTGPGGAWQSESTLNSGSISNGAGGGGISSFWTIPSYQSQAGVITAAAGASSSMRNVPDVALNADPNSGYSMYYRNNWYVVGGTSCAAPLWAAFTALVNQQRVANGKSVLGFANPALYSIGVGSNGETDFHDIADNSTNLYYSAVTGYDLATGWGSFNGANLLADLAAGSGGGTTPPPPAVTQLLVNPGFENGLPGTPWRATPAVIDNSNSEPAHSGQWKAWLDGYTSAHTDGLFQQVTIPANITKATFTFYLHVDTYQRTTTQVVDYMKAQVRDPNNVILKLLQLYSNLNAAPGYSLQTFDVTAFKGQTIRLYFLGVQTGSTPTSFVIDDCALDVQ
jgi:subtilase family serine protease